MPKRNLRGFQLQVFGFGYKTDFPSFPRTPSFRPRPRLALNPIHFQTVST